MSPEDQKNAERRARQLAEADQTLEMAFSSEYTTAIYNFDSSSTDGSAKEDSDSDQLPLVNWETSKKPSGSDKINLVNWATPTIDVGSFRPSPEDYVEPVSKQQPKPTAAMRSKPRDPRGFVDGLPPDIAKQKLPEGEKQFLRQGFEQFGDGWDPGYEGPFYGNGDSEGESPDDRLFGRSSTLLADQTVEPQPTMESISSLGNQGRAQSPWPTAGAETRKPGEDPPEKEWQPEDWRRDTPEKSSSTSAIRSNDQEQSATLETNAQTSESFIDAVATVMSRLSSAVINAHQRLDEIERTLDGYDIDDFSGAE